MVKRLVFFVSGIFIACLGMVLNTKTDLGVSALVSFPFLLSKITSLTLGNATTIIYFVFVLLQIILQRKITLKVLLQIPFSYVFGVVIDFYNLFINFKVSGLALRFGLLGLAISITGIGAYLLVRSDIALVPLDGFAKTISEKMKIEFGKFKLMFDSGFVGLTVIVSLIYTGRIIGVGIGTIIAAFTLGNVILFVGKNFDKYIVPIVNESKEKYKF